MFNTRLTFSALVLAALVGCTNDNPLTLETPENSNSEASLAKTAISRNKTFVLNVVGADIGEAGLVPDIDGDGQLDPANCFDLQLIDLSTGKVAGTARDCVSNLIPVGDGFSAVTTTYFSFGKKDTIVVRGLGSVQPKISGSVPITHLTGAIPSPGDNNILYGTGKYAGATGSARLSGALNLAHFGTNECTFDYLWVIKLNESN